MLLAIKSPRAQPNEFIVPLRGGSSNNKRFSVRLYCVYTPRGHHIHHIKLLRELRLWLHSNSGAWHGSCFHTNTHTAHIHSCGAHIIGHLIAHKFTIKMLALPFRSVMMILGSYTIISERVYAYASIPYIGRFTVPILGRGAHAALSLA